MTSDLKALFEYYQKEKGIDTAKMVDALSQAILAASRKSIGPAREMNIHIDPDKGTIRATAKLIAVEKADNKFEQISLKAAAKIKPDVQIGDEIEVEIPPQVMGRIAAQTAKQTMMQRLRMAEKENLYEEFKDRTGDVVNGTVRRFDKSDVIVDLGKFEGVMPNKERVSTEEYNIGDRMRFYVKAVEKDGSRGPEIVLSRAHPNFVRRLFEFECAEISDRTVDIISISREAGYRTKVAVHSADDKIDPVGACVGMRGARVKNIVRELNNEKVDIIRWNPDHAEFIREALKPIKILSIRVTPDKSTAYITVSEEELSKAIGRKGQNARLTSRLVNMELNIDRDVTAEQAFAAQIGSAASHLVDALEIDDATATLLTNGGLGDLRNFAGVDIEDIAEVLGGDSALAKHIYDKAQARNR
jgi:transcription termination/antitermination protein NusA